jgi:signal transduction histidine kinase
MLYWFKRGSIRWQIVTLAVLPIFLVGVLGVMTEPRRVEETELTQAEIAAAQMALVAEQVESAPTPELADLLLAATRKSGLDVQWASPFFQQSDDGSIFQERLMAALSDLHHRKAWAVEGGGPDGLIVVEVRGGLLVFAPAIAPVPGLNDDVINIMLSVVIIFLPVAFLSVYAARLVTNPLIRIANAAEVQGGADPGGAIFDESGPLEIRQLARRLNEMRAQIHNMLKERTAMLRAVSHDLRTPLTRLKLRVERSVPPETAAALIRDISAINEMIDETLNYLRNETETELPRKVDLSSLLRTVCSDFADMGFSVTYFGPERLALNCRPRSVARAVSNLVDNATKFGTAVEVVLRRQQDQRVCIDVADDGPGIPENLRSKVLEPFVKGDLSRPAASGAGFGLGLSIVRDIAQRHGGTVMLNPRNPKGLVATLVIASAPVPPL